MVLARGQGFHHAQQWEYDQRSQNTVPWPSLCWTHSRASVKACPTYGHPPGSRRCGNTAGCRGDVPGRDGCGSSVHEFHDRAACIKGRNLRVSCGWAQSLAFCSSIEPNMRTSGAMGRSARDLARIDLELLLNLVRSETRPRSKLTTSFANREREALVRCIREDADVKPSKTPITSETQ